MLNLFKKTKKLKIIHMASLARSGETLLLRCLNAHKRIHVVHNLKSKDSNIEQDLFEFLKGYEEKYISQKHKMLSGINLEGKDILLLKQGVWNHKYDFDGFILARNPVSVYSSLLTYDSNDLDWKHNNKRIKRWLHDMGYELENNFDNKSPIEQFCELYNHRMGHLLNLDLPVIYYENFVTNPELEIRKICSIMSIDYCKDILFSHEDYGSDEIGHGKNNLSEKINSNSLTKYQNIITRQDFDKIKSLTSKVTDSYAYIMDWDSIKL